MFCRSTDPSRFAREERHPYTYPPSNRGIPYVCVPDLHILLVLSTSNEALLRGFALGGCRTAKFVSEGRAPIPCFRSFFLQHMVV